MWNPYPLLVPTVWHCMINVLLLNLLLLKLFTTSLYQFTTKIHHLSNATKNQVRASIFLHTTIFSSKEFIN